MTSEWTRNELAGQVFIFFAAGFESSATVLVMTVHELAINPDVQEKLYQEIKNFKEEHGELTYDKLSALKYLDCVINGTTNATILTPNLYILLTFAPCTRFLFLCFFAELQVSQY